MNRTALYTTIYPGVEQYLADWCLSLNSQDERAVDLWIGVDNVAIDLVADLISRKFPVNYIMAAKGETPTSLRSRAMAQMTATYESIIFTDSDDILCPTRVSAALRALEDADVNGCALGVLDEAGHDLGIFFGLEGDEDPCEILPRYNFLGLSNTAWRADALSRCLPVPDTCVAMDWFLATRAWASDARISFDRTIRMGYRQYGRNTACVVPPFTADQIVKATEVVSSHYRLILAGGRAVPASLQLTLQMASGRVEKFRNKISASRETLDAYVTALNQLPPHRLWWLSVAHPSLEDIWNC